MAIAAACSHNVARSAVLCSLAGALLSLPIASQAASKTLTISGRPASTVTVLSDYSFTPKAQDTVQSRIKFNIYNKPAWASFDGTTGRLYGKPGRFEAGTYKNITIRLTDWYGYVTTPAFSITVTKAAPKPAPAVPAPPSSGSATKTNTPGTTTAGTTTPPAAGTTGQPASSGNGSSGSVTSGNVSSASASSGTGSSVSVTLDWTPPTETTDGSFLSNLAGYNVHYGTSPNDLAQVIKVSNAGIASLVVDNLNSGTWYFSVTSYNSQGFESPSSDVVSTRIL